MKVQIGNKIYGGENKPIVIHLTEEDKKVIAQMGEHRNFLIISDKQGVQLSVWLKNNTMIPKESIEALKLQGEYEKA